MIVRDLSPIPYQEGNISLSDRTQAIMKFGTGWPADMKSQDALIRQLEKTLDNTFAILRNVTLQKAEVIVPLILIGPPGITVIYNSPAKGVFRTQGSSWSTMGGRGSFQPAKPNLIMRTTLMAGAVQTYLEESDYSDLPVDCILALTDPGTHVDAIRPDARVVMIDALEGFAAQLMSSQAIFDQTRRFKLVEYLSEMSKPQAEIAEPTNTPSTDISHSLDAGFDSALKPIRRRANFSKRQWLILGAFVIIEVIVLLLFMIIILFTS